MRTGYALRPVSLYNTVHTDSFTATIIIIIIIIMIIIIRAYGIPQQIILVITNFFNSFKDRVGNSEGCPMSVLLFNLTSHWATCKTTLERPRGIRWTPFSTLEDLDLAPDLALVSHTYQHMQKKTTHLRIFAPTSRPEYQPEEDRAPGQSKRAEIFQEPNNLPSSVAFSSMTAEQASTSGIASRRPGTLSEC